MKKHLIILLTAGIICLLGMLPTATAQTLTVTLTPSNHNGFNVSCFGGIDGSINATVTGGNAPYTYLWSNGATTQNITGLAAGYYNLVVKDFSGTISQRNEVTLTQPQILRLTPSIYEYPNGYNISLYNAYNGSIAITITGGVTNYSYLWDDGTVTQNRTSLGAGGYIVTVTDANACTVKSEQINLRQPDRSDWRMDGNTGSNPTTNFIGTKDSIDFSLRTNNAERFRIAGNGDLKIGKLAGNGIGLIYADANGILFKPIPTAPQPWMTGGNNTGATSNIIGTSNYDDFIIATNLNGSGGEVMRITKTSKVGIGTTNPGQKLEIAHDVSSGGIWLTRLSTTTMKNQISFRQNAYEKWSIGNDATESNINNFFIYGGSIPGVNTTTPRVQMLFEETGNIMFGNIDYNAIVNADNNNQIYIKSDDDRPVGLAVEINKLNSSNILYGIKSVVNATSLTDANALKAITVVNSQISSSDPLCKEVFRVLGNGFVEAKDVKVYIAGWCDYVFRPEYQLPSLSELKKYVTLNNHLPEIPSENEININGLVVSDMFKLQMKKIEELTLYIIQQNEKIETLEKDINLLKQQTIHNAKGGRNEK